MGWKVMAHMNALLQQTNENKLGKIHSESENLLMRTFML
jgi:hypothetical protein